MNLTFDGSDTIPEDQEIKQLRFKIGDRDIVHTPSSLHALVRAVSERGGVEYATLVFKSPYEIGESIIEMAKEGYEFCYAIASPTEYVVVMKR